MSIIIALLFFVHGPKMYKETKRNTAYMDSAKGRRSLQQVLPLFSSSLSLFKFLSVNYLEICFLMKAFLFLFLSFFNYNYNFVLQVALLSVICSVAFFLRGIFIIPSQITTLGPVLGLLDWSGLLILFELLPEMIILYGMGKRG
jgi:hypothetical protein